jgi:hypothetical protein
MSALHFPEPATTACVNEQNVLYCTFAKDVQEKYYYMLLGMK